MENATVASEKTEERVEVHLLLGFIQCAAELVVVRKLLVVRRSLCIVTPILILINEE